MPSRQDRRRFSDIAQAAGRMAQVTAGRTCEEYRTDPMLRSRVDRELTILGEALNELFGGEKAPRAPDSRVRRRGR
ncbi:hypothetical protein [Methanoculleus sp.]|uniref:hypothetical protein n=1 Tax=Methanoculleus sp. TaxID=90427 RepID=UPI0025CDCBC7|nr:hypothetical protein [Methanoculleus sp.]